MNRNAFSTGAVVFTGLDGTLLDQETRAWTPAAPALAALKARGLVLVQASSKTAAEIETLQAELGLAAVPAIVENGAGIFRPGTPTTDDSAYRAIRTALDALPRELRVFFRGFADMSAFEVAQITGLASDAAARARKRNFSEPGTWLGDAATLKAFLDALAARGIAARRAARFLTLSHGASKARRMAEIAAELGATETLALGSSPNDIEMLEASHRGVILRNDHAPALPRLAGEDAGNITRTDTPGPDGWNAAVLAWLDTISRKSSPEGA